ncbi:MAG: uncharacterized protein KVP18_004174 [Porospora cf. gigantea A]|uniref:uncharacterized protein n=1 Tax=Porospora cf. gigantea A TaxID=2853593 RepID=UPI0035597D3B|nr:MAG: hypothetical protein KVP18_004174 [Porospora cf. gigantea A]
MTSVLQGGTLKRTLFVGGLQESVSKDVLRAAFIPFGEVLNVDIPDDRMTKKHKGFGFVEFEEEDDADEAIANMHDAELYGQVLTVNKAHAPRGKTDARSKPVWADDFFYRKRLALEGLDVDPDVLDEELLKASAEAKSRLKEEQEKHYIEKVNSSQLRKDYPNQPAN